jgi:hypothetical protein
MRRVPFASKARSLPDSNWQLQLAPLLGGEVAPPHGAFGTMIGQLRCFSGTPYLKETFMDLATAPHSVSEPFFGACYRRIVQRLLLLVIVLLTGSVSLAQEPVASTPLDQETAKALLQRIEQLEARVQQLEAREGSQSARTTELATQADSSRVVHGRPLATTSAQAGMADQNESTSEEEQPQGPERMDISKTLLRIRGFGDITLHGDNNKGDTTAFTLGQLDLFVTSDVSEKFRFLSEIVFEAGPNPSNLFNVDLERYLLQYSPNEYFNLSVGRFHTAIGYYNTAYHHSTWFQTTTGRPFMFAFEDEGGILPVHTVGASATGRIPSGDLGLHYVAEVGNGRASSNSLAEPVQNAVDENNHKALNVALFARPRAIHGLQFGMSAYRDVLTPQASSPIGETILAAHAVYTVPAFEWLNEAVLIRHAPQGLGHTFQTPGFYTQISKAFGSYRPYFRYQYINAPDDEPVFGDSVLGFRQGVGLRQGPSLGLRYDASESVAVKLQYDYTALRHQQAINALALQVGFTF